jgi:hypothetical protein
METNVTMTITNKPAAPLPLRCRLRLGECRNVIMRGFVMRFWARGDRSRGDAAGIVNGRRAVFLGRRGGLRLQSDSVALALSGADTPPFPQGARAGR